MTPHIYAYVLSGFDDSAISQDVWMHLLGTGDTNTVNLTWLWQRNWWETFGHGQLLLTVAEVDGQVVAIAPFFADGGMIFNLCPEDHLDFIGDISLPQVLDALLETARQSVPNFVGFNLYFVPDRSQTGQRLRAAAERLNLMCAIEQEFPSPLIDAAREPDKALACTRKQSLVRHERFFQREGNLEVFHSSAGDQILPHLDAFFQQHIRRRAAIGQTSIFDEEIHRAYYRRICHTVAPTGWLRFTRLNWNGRPIAFHFGLSYNGRYLYGIPSFEVDMSRHSPGEVLLRQLLLAAIEEGVAFFDFGIGDEAYKYRFATDVIRLHTWGLYLKN